MGQGFFPAPVDGVEEETVAILIAVEYKKGCVHNVTDIDKSGCAGGVDTALFCCHTPKTGRVLMLPISSTEHVGGVNNGYLKAFRLSTPHLAFGGELALGVTGIRALFGPAFGEGHYGPAVATV